VRAPTGGESGTIEVGENPDESGIEFRGLITAHKRAPNRAQILCGFRQVWLAQSGRMKPLGYRERYGAGGIKRMNRKCAGA